MSKLRNAAVFAFGCLTAGAALADAGRVDGYVSRLCNAAPVGCYITTHQDRTTKWLRFVSDRRDSCYVTMKNCGANGCGFLTVHLDLPVRDGNRVLATAKLRGDKRQDYVFHFDESQRLGVLNNGFKEVQWDITNYRVDPYRPGHQVTSYFTYAGEQSCQ